MTSHLLRGVAAIGLLTAGFACAPSESGSIGTTPGTQDEPGTTAPGRAGAAEEAGDSPAAESATPSEDK